METELRPQIVMARYSRRSENEQLLRLERPSSSSTQSSSHVIDSCFNEILSQPTLDAKEIYNLALSRRGSSDYHEGFITELKRVSDEYEQKLRELDAVEQHLLQARAKSLAADEKALSQTVHPTVATLKGKSKYSDIVDEELLSQHRLLVPSSYLWKTPAMQPQPQGEHLPSFLKPTQTAVQHAKFPLLVDSKESSHEISKQKTVPKLPLSLMEKEFERDAIESLERNYMQNPKYSSKCALTNTSSTGPLKMKSSHSKRALDVFIAEPKEVVFSKYQPGEVYQKVVHFKNVSGVSRHLRVIPLESSHFSASLENFPTPDCSIAPGMHCDCVIKFSADSLAIYEEHLKVLSHCGECLTVPLKATKHFPELNLPRTLECGHFLVGTRSTVQFSCQNSGGEGCFKLLRNRSHSVDALQIGAFTISPTNFFLAEGGKTDLLVEFVPSAVGSFCETFEIAFGDYEVHTFNLTGTGEQVNVQFIGLGYKHESGSAAEPEQYPTLDFGSINPHTSSSRTVSLKNNSNVDLSYSWRFYRPATEVPVSDGLPGPFYRKPPILVQSKHSPFSIKPSAGTLNAQDAINFTFFFLPQKVDTHIDMAHFIVLDAPPSSLPPNDSNCAVVSDHEVSVARLKAIGHALPYRVDLYPPLIILPQDMPVGENFTIPFKISNQSLMPVQYDWKRLDHDGLCSMTVNPPSGHIEPNTIVDCDLMCVGEKAGAFVECLQCSINLSDSAIFLSVEGTVQPPVVTMDVANLNFGLIPLGQSAALHFSISNRSKCPVMYDVQQAVTDVAFKDNEFMDHKCLRLSPCSGEIEPLGSVTVDAVCTPEAVGRLRSTLECHVQGKLAGQLQVKAEVQRPVVALDQSRIHFKKAFFGIKVERTLHLKNFSLISTRFSWNSRLLGESVDKCRVEIKPQSGEIGPDETVSISLCAEWKEVGSYDEVVAMCRVDGMEKPIFLALSSEVYGPSVDCSIVAPLAIRSKELVLDFGHSNHLREPTSLHLKMTNTSAIAVHISFSINYFKPLDTFQKDTQTEGNSKHLLRNTENPATCSLSAQQKFPDKVSALLASRKGCCFVVEPSSLYLPGFESSVVDVTAYSDMWGSYKDKLIYQVSDLEPVVVPVTYGVKGCPLLFQTSATYGHTTARFGCHSTGDQPVDRELVLKNTSPNEIRINWFTFNLEEHDQKSVDLIHYFGEPFPPDDGETAMATACDGEGNESPLITTCESDKLSLVKVILKPHEGIPSKKPFSIHPKQLILPPYNHKKLYVTFQPSQCIFSSEEMSLESYVLGYISLNENSCASEVQRKSGYDVEPLRIDLKAGVIQPLLYVEFDEEDGHKFSYLASTLIEGNKVLQTSIKSHNFIMKNKSTSIFSFKVFTRPSSPFAVSVEDAGLITLIPQESKTAKVNFCISRDDLQDDSSDKKMFSSQLVILFSSGSEQVINLEGKITLPSLVVSETVIDFGTCLLGKPYDRVVYLHSSSPSNSLWRTENCSEIEAVSVYPSSGTIRHSEKTAVIITFTPREERSYSTVIGFQDIMTGVVKNLQVCGDVSADEYYGL